jgi:Ferric reductase like transmembrane component
VPVSEGVVASSTTLWYLSRGTGIVTLLFLTASVLLGIVTSYRWSSPAWPRFVIEFVHRNVSLLVVVFLALHVVTVVTDSFAPIGWKDAVVPFASPYRRVWLGLGAVACDLVLALVVTSLLRHRIGFRTWRIVHWFAYLCWPVAVVHGLGTGSDARLGVVLAITAVCVTAVLLATSLRLAAGLADHAGARRVGFAAWAFAPVVLAIWVVSGPLASGWARRAGTPASVLAAAQPAAATAAPAAVPPTTPAPRATGSLASGIQADFSGTFHQTSPDAQGEIVVSLVGQGSAGAGVGVDVELRGHPVRGGGVSLERGTVTLSGGTGGDEFTGAVVGLQDQAIVADVVDAGGQRLQVTLNVTELDDQTGRMAGSLVAAPLRGAAPGGDDR